MTELIIYITAGISSGLIAGLFGKIYSVVLNKFV